MKKFIIALAAFATAAIGAGAAIAASAAIEAAKDECIVGEGNDGYLAVVTGKSVDSNLAREIRANNQQRKAAYARLAQQNGVTVEVAAQLTAEQLISRAQSGECVQDASGGWTMVP